MFYGEQFLTEGLSDFVKKFKESRKNKKTKIDKVKEVEKVEYKKYSEYTPEEKKIENDFEELVYKKVREAVNKFNSDKEFMDKVRKTLADNKDSIHTRNQNVIDTFKFKVCDEDPEYVCIVDEDDDICVYVFPYLQKIARYVANDEDIKSYASKYDKCVAFIDPDAGDGDEGCIYFYCGFKK